MDMALLGKIIVVVASIVIVGAVIRLWSRSASRPRRRPKAKGVPGRWRPDIGSGAGFGLWGGGSGGGLGGDPGGGDVGGGCD